jgi:hypothetical protein
MPAIFLDGNAEHHRPALSETPRNAWRWAGSTGAGDGAADPPHHAQRLDLDFRRPAGFRMAH